MKRVLLAVLILFAGGIVSPAVAQVATGNIYGTAADEQGGVLPGVASSGS